MKIIIINGSHRKNGSTAFILNELLQELNKYDDVDVQFIHVADLSLNYCVGCGTCYRTGKCIYRDDVEALSSNIASADGIILGSPTYASNVSAQMKTIIDRGHFVMEQLLYGKYAISVTTYENYGGTDTAKIMNRLLSYSGAKVCGKILFRKKSPSNLMEKYQSNKYIQKLANTLYWDIKLKRKYILQSIKQFIIFKIGIKPFVINNAKQYAGVIDYWKSKNIT
jgi:multimeric flavodoxin WrbA